MRLQLSRTKKNGSFIIILVLFLLLSSCDRSLSPELNLPPEANTSYKQDSSKGKDNTDLENTVKPSDEAAALTPQDAYKGILQGTLAFFSVDAAQDVDITNIDRAVSSESLPIIAKQFSLVHLDTDDVPELILWLAMSDGKNDYVGFELLHYDEGRVYGYMLWPRAFINVKTDRTFSFSSSASEGGFGTIEFLDGTYSVNKIAYSESFFDSDCIQHIQYYINQTPANEKEYHAVIALQDEKEGVVWKELSDKNIEALSI